VVIALVITPDGFPLAYEVMDGNHQQHRNHGLSVKRHYGPERSRQGNAEPDRLRVQLGTLRLLRRRRARIVLLTMLIVVLLGFTASCGGGGSTTITTTATRSSSQLRSPVREVFTPPSLSR
jgi:hypothetical protein